MIWRWEVISECLKDPKLGAEIGVKEGRFISYLLKVHPNLKMYAVDPWEAQEGASEDYLDWPFDKIYAKYRKNVDPYKERVIELMEYSENAASLVKDGSLDFVFLDAQHDYESVKRDIELWRPKVKKGGLLSGHDYCKKFDGVMKAVDELDEVMLSNNDVWGLWV